MAGVADDLAHLDAFVAAARSPSAASMALADLEVALRMHLFHGLGRGLVLNEDAERRRRTKSARPSCAVRRPCWAHPKGRVQRRSANKRHVIDDVRAFDVDVGFIEASQSHADVIARPWLMNDPAVVAAPGHACESVAPTRAKCH